MNQTASLFEYFAPATLPPHACVVWKPINIVRPHNGTGAHHPSAAGGFHDWLNRIAAALAQQVGIRALDTSPVMGALRPRGWRNADALGRHGFEGDPYHGFAAGGYVPQLLAQICTACPQLARHAIRL